MLKKYLIPLFVFSFFLSRSCTLHDYGYCKVSGDKKCCLVQSHSHINSNGSHELPKLNRKYRTKGLLSVLPAIPDIPFFRNYIFNDYYPGKFSKEPTYKEEGVQLKRGPPLKTS